MPLVLLNKARNAKRPALPPDVYAPAALNVGPFANAWVGAARATISEEAFVEAYRRAAARPGPTVEHILAAFPELADPAALEPMALAYLRVIQDTGVIEKRRRAVPTVRVNPNSIEWAKERGSRLIRNISADTRETVRNIVARHIARGERADSMVPAIRRAVGLLPREERAVDTRRSLLIDQGVAADRVESISDKYAAELLEARAIRIARTETIAAQNRGLLDTWQQAAESGALPGTVIRVWASAPESENPNRPCQICLDLDNQEAALDEPFESELLDESVMTPPAHPNCRCTMTLKRGGS